MKSLVLAEKPSVGKEIARVLNCKKRTKTFCEGKDYIVSWGLGHLVELAEPGDYKSEWREWKLESLPMIPEKMRLKVMKKTSHQFKSVRQLMNRKDVNELIIATDAGREGELVARWIMILGGWKKNFKRLWISSQTDAAIKEGFAKLRPGREYDKLFHAAVCRAEADWLIGLNVTRALTCKFDAQLTAGRVQSPTLAIIVEREEEIKKFKPVPYWKIRVEFNDFFAHWQDKNGSSRIFHQDKLNRIYDKISNNSGKIINIQSKTKKEAPPLAYDLTELQRDANRRFGFSAKHTLSITQVLYERHKLLTYPRTDSRYITTDMVPTLVTRLKQNAHGAYARLITPLLKSKLRLTTRFVNNAKVSDHHAIIPTELKPNMSSLSTDEKRIFDLVLRRFIAVLYPPYIYDQITITTDINGENFVSRGKIVKESGWQQVTVIKKDNIDNKEVLPDQLLTSQTKGSVKQVKKILKQTGKTNPPARYTEATLLTAMEGAGKFIEDEELRESIKAGGLGTPATRAEIIEKLFNSYYIERHGKSIHPTSKGKQLIDLVPEELKSPELTAKWEQRLSEISKGSGSRKGFITDIRKNSELLVAEVKKSTKEYKADNLTKHKCAICGKPMMEVIGKKGKKLVCSDRRCGFEQTGNQGDGMRVGRRSKKEQRMVGHLVHKYGKDKHEKVEDSLGDLLEQALRKKNK